MMCRKSDPNSQELCAGLLRAGEVLILPTDTVYGFSGAVGRTDGKIRAVKGRAEEKPFIQLVAAPADAADLAYDRIPPELLARWPGALTVIVRSKADPQRTVAVRCG
ncbi:MAG: Sua5/YciO/YrdC/YwlC family protein, partial [Treponemataceae bacterium]|nr:Sua5/YciO/YrdC/YwlC family protein [Treponemataceae bacterium]